jgi:hypothetical protein
MRENHMSSTCTYDDPPLQVLHTYRNHQSWERLFVVPLQSPYFNTFVPKFHSKLLPIWLLTQVCSIFDPIDHIYKNEWTEIKYRIKSQHYKKHHDVSLCSSRDVDGYVKSGCWRPLGSWAKWPSSFDSTPGKQQNWICWQAYRRRLDRVRRVFIFQNTQQFS